MFCRSIHDDRFVIRKLDGRRRGGFSLMELVIVMVIVGLILATAAPRWEGYTANQRLASAQDRMASLLHLARQRAIDRRTPVNVIFMPNLRVEVREENDTGVEPLASVDLGNESEYQLSAIEYSVDNDRNDTGFTLDHECTCTFDASGWLTYIVGDGVSRDNSPSNSSNWWFRIQLGDHDRPTWITITSDGRILKENVSATSPGNANFHDICPPPNQNCS